MLLAVMLFFTPLKGDEPNPRLQNFRRGTGKASWWEPPQATQLQQPRFQTFYYPPAVRYYQPYPYYHYRHHPRCRCFACVRRNQQVIIWQLQMKLLGET